jgi:hypothetical protein
MTNFQTQAELDAATLDATRSEFFVGLDLGQSVDPTALCVLERVETPILHLGHRVPMAPIHWTKAYRVRHLERFPLGMSYPLMVARVGMTVKTAPLFRNHKLIIDQTGVGRPVFDLFKQAKLAPIGVTITAGDDWSKDGLDRYRVSKGLLVSRLDAALHSGILQIAAELPEADALRSELADFRMSHTASGYQQFGARSGRHDDLVLSVAIALWYSATIGEQRIRKMKMRI